MRQLKIIPQITNRENVSLDKYLQEISKYSLITADEEVLLCQKIREGDKDALNRLTLANLRFVVSVAKQYQHRSLSLPDLINEGNVGLIIATRKFDETRGFKFISYAVWWIRQSIISAIANQSRVVRLPLNKISSLSKVDQARSLLEQKLERQPSVEEIAEASEIEIHEINSSLSNRGFHLSMDAPLINAEEKNMYDVLLDHSKSSKPDDGLMKESLMEEIRSALSSLSEREARVISLIFGLNGGEVFSLQEIGEELNITRERVRQIKETALRKLKTNACKRKLQKFFD